MDTKFSDIKTEYEQIRMRNERELNRKQEEIYNNLPEYKEAETRMRLIAIDAAKRKLNGENIDIDFELSEIADQKRAILANAGYPIDYLELRYDCEDCKDMGRLSDGRLCSCFKQKLISRYYQMSNIEKNLKRENFDTFDEYLFSEEIPEGEEISPRENILKIKQIANDFIENFSDPKTFNLLFYGGTGLGKTFLCNCIAKELIDKGHTVLYQRAYKIIETLENYRFRRDESTEAFEKYSFIFDAELLIIDDLGTELITQFTNSEIFNIINERKESNKKTIISTNLTPEKIQEIYTDRVLSRIAENYIITKFIGKDLRWS
ncbi:MAG: ATP-binding protein [Tissierellia bacterium]|nr:ATP-binding protein [Tissierellia bacterium]